MSRFYVYALIDPRTKSPKYIGKGLSNRTEAHMRQAAPLSDEARIVGVETEDVWASDEETIQENSVSKEAWIAELLTRGYSHADIARVVARDLDEHAAFTLESFLIHSVYGKSSLLNLQAGHNAERFRPKGDWVAWDESAVVAGHDWYVYVLCDPRGGIDTTDGVFYVGKGRGSRLDMHFVDANRIHGEPDDPERLRKVRSLLDAGLSRDQIGFVVARVATEQEAFLIEALLIKFVYGVTSLTNQVAGHHAWAIRPREHWGVLPGFDLARVIDPGVRQDRSELLELLLAEGLGNLLDHVRHPLAATLLFGEYQVLDAGEVGMESPLGGTLLKVFTRRKKIQLELRPRTKGQRTWMRHRFKSLGAEHLLRGDAVFIPLQWRGANRMTDSAEEAVVRARLLLELGSDLSKENLSAEARALLESPEPLEARSDRVEPPDGCEPDDLASVEQPGTLPEPGRGGGGDGLRPLLQLPVPPEDDGCDARLNAIAEIFPDIAFDLPRPRDAGELAIEGLIGAEGPAPGAILKVSCRKSGFGLELRGRTRDRKVWLHEHLSGLGCTLPRAMNPAEVVFLPTAWKGAARMAQTVEAAAHRITLLLQIISATSPDDLDDEARDLLYE